MLWNREWARPGTGAAVCGAEGVCLPGPLLPSPQPRWRPWSCSVETKTVSCSCRPLPVRFLPQLPSCRRNFSFRPPPHCRRIRSAAWGIMPELNRFNIRRQCFLPLRPKMQLPSRNSRVAIPDRSPGRKSRRSLFRWRRIWPPFRSSSMPATTMRAAESGSVSA